MRTAFLATTAVLVAMPAYAADIYAPPPITDPIYAPAPMTVVGHLDMGIGFSKWEYFSEGEGLFEAAGRANIPFNNGWNLQVEAGGGGAFFNDGDSFASLGAAAHIWNRGAAGALGFFGGVNFGTGYGVTTGFVGVEGEFDLGESAAIGAQAAYGFGQHSYNYWTLRGWGSYYFSPNTKLRGEVAYASINDDAKAWDLSAELEHRFNASPISVFGKLGYTNVDYWFGGSQSNWRGLIGARIFMDQPGTTLRDHDRQVPWDVRSLDGIGWGFPPV